VRVYKTPDGRFFGPSCVLLRRKGGRGKKVDERDVNLLQPQKKVVTYLLLFIFIFIFYRFFIAFMGV
jgi:hypothetical protein